MNYAKRSILALGVVLFIGVAANNASAQTTPDTAKKTTTTTTTPAPAQSDAANVVQALQSNSDYSTAFELVKEAKLDSALTVGGPYTIFAPTNNAFNALPAGTIDALKKDPAKLATILKGHVVNGTYDKAGLIKALSAGKGKATVTTLDGQTLTLSVTADKKLQLTTAAGKSAQVVLYDLKGGTGVVNGINAVLQ
ncbi:fasciclin domain-containing protein [Mucilaginibacter achroorhodeus]|uniref:Fasciclin domain-containing protein n=1 Tax=Mucilaginibacter achroorhodeus TaxID=2599294 RepID=A0A563U736_9SPHI|nr:fasciclin domain-containing protein [Mucilaginibacter achroorhodeus]TWR27155.1 fasciclin domain-containing protein [Mucilaginibacter achroorhodeus]